jgi:hypothetical protein
MSLRASSSRDVGITYFGDGVIQFLRDAGRRAASETEKRGRYSSCCSVSVLTYIAAMLLVLMVLLGKIVHGTIYFICSPSDTEYTVLWLLTDFVDG